MALPASPNAISLGQVNTELGITSTIVISLNDAAVRTLFAISSGPIAMSDGHGKSAVNAPVITANPSAFVWTAGGYALNYSSANHRNVEYSAASTPAILATYSTIFGSTETDNSALGVVSLAYTVSGTNNVYRWQYAPNLTVGMQYSDVIGTAESNAPNGSPLVYDYPQFDNYSSGWGGSPQSGTGDLPVVANTATLSITMTAHHNTTYVHPETGGDAPPNHYDYIKRSCAGWWRLKISNSAGTVYSGWTNIQKYWRKYSFECDCTGDCTGCCDENNENCSCDCTSGCSTCYGWNASSLQGGGFFQYHQTTPPYPILTVFT